MNTNQFWNTENIKALASLWPLALIFFLTLLLLVLVLFFLPQTRGFLDGLRNFRFKFWKTEVSVNQPPSAPPKTSPETPVQEATAGTSKAPEKEAAPPDERKEPESDLDPEQEMYIHLLGGMLDEAEKVFDKLQSNENDPEARIQREAIYLRLRFEKGDLSAQDKLHALEVRAKENNSSWLGFIMRMDGLCYVFSRKHSEAAQQFKVSALSCRSEVGRAKSLSLAAKSLYELGQKDEAFQVLKGALDIIHDARAKIDLLTGLADLYQKEGDNFNRALALQRALSFQPNSKDLLFSTAYACADADLQELALLHYEKLVQIDLRHSSALNNLGVVYANLKIPNLAVKNYKSAMAIDETLAAANFAHILIEAGIFDEAEKVLKEAQTKKDVDQNVAGALVKLEQEKKAGEGSRTENLNLANAQYQFLLEFSDATFSNSLPNLVLDGKWKSASGEIVSAKKESSPDKIELIWTEAPDEKFRFYGPMNGLASKGKIEKWSAPSAYLGVLLGGKQDGKFEAFGNGFLFLSKNSDTITVFIQKSGDKSHRSLSFRKSSG